MARTYDYKQNNPYCKNFEGVPPRGLVTIYFLFMWADPATTFVPPRRPCWAILTCLLAIGLFEFPLLPLFNDVFSSSTSFTGAAAAFSQSSLTSSKSVLSLKGNKLNKLFVFHFSDDMFRAHSQDCFLFVTYLIGSYWKSYIHKIISLVKDINNVLRYTEPGSFFKLDGGKQTGNEQIKRGWSDSDITDIIFCLQKWYMKYDIIELGA